MQVNRFSKLSKIPSSERVTLSRTSKSLFKILSRIISLETKKNDSILLQPPLNHRDYGQARIIDTKKCMLWRKNDTSLQEIYNYDEYEKKILAFARYWTHQVDDSQSDNKVVGDFDELFGISSNDEEDTSDDDESYLSDLSIHASQLDLKNALHKGFGAPENEGSELLKKDVLDMQRFAIDSINFFEEQRKMWERTSISIDEERGVRVIAVSKCIGVSASGHRDLTLGSDVKHRFAYRIRIDNFNQPETDDGKEGQDNIQHALDVLPY